jgi:hypothetical protein
MTPDNNKVQFLTNVTSLLIPQRMNSFNKEEKVNFVKWYYFGLSFRDSKQHFLYSIRSDQFQVCHLKYHCYLWLSPRFHFPAIAILTKALIFFFIIVYFRKMLKNKTNKNWEPFLKLYNFCI